MRLVRVKKASLEVGQLEGTLIDARKAELAWSDLITTARNRLLMIPDAAATKFGDECREWLKAEIRRALTELSEYRTGA
jgi:hypothetical protein